MDDLTNLSPMKLQLKSINQKLKKELKDMTELYSEEEEKYFQQIQRLKEELKEMKEKNEVLQNRIYNSYSFSSSATSSNSSPSLKSKCNSPALNKSLPKEHAKLQEDYNLLLDEKDVLEDKMEKMTEHLKTLEKLLKNSDKEEMHEIVEELRLKNEEQEEMIIKLKSDIVEMNQINQDLQNCVCHLQNELENLQFCKTFDEPNISLFDELKEIEENEPEEVTEDELSKIDEEEESELDELNIPESVETSEVNIPEIAEKVFHDETAVVLPYENMQSFYKENASYPSKETVLNIVKALSESEIQYVLTNLLNPFIPNSDFHHRSLQNYEIISKLIDDNTNPQGGQIMPDAHNLSIVKHHSVPEIKDVKIECAELPSTPEVKEKDPGSILKEYGVVVDSFSDLAFPLHFDDLQEDVSIETKSISFVLQKFEKSKSVPNLTVTNSYENLPKLPLEDLNDSVDLNVSSSTALFSTVIKFKNEGDLFDVIADAQCRRIDDQRCESGILRDVSNICQSDRFNTSNSKLNSTKDSGRKSLLQNFSKFRRDKLNFSVKKNIKVKHEKSTIPFSSSTPFSRAGKSAEALNSTK